MEFCRVSPDVKLGKDVKIFAFVNLYGCAIGDNTKVGTFVEIQKNAFIGANCKISSHTFICDVPGHAQAGMHGVIVAKP